MVGKYKNKYRIESNRLQLWDYSSPGSYFITICIAERKCILGNVRDAKMELSELGRIVESEFLKIPEYHKRVLLDTWVIMPNHVHCIITLGNYNFDNGISSIGDNDDTTDTNVGGGSGDDGGGDGDGGDGDGGGCGGGGRAVEKIHEFSLRKQRRKMIIPKIAGKFQMQTSKQMNILRNTPGVKNWQPNYYDHIIRNEKSYHNISNYIINNPSKWENDKLNNGKGNIVMEPATAYNSEIWMV